MSNRKSYRVAEHFICKRKNGLKQFMWLMWALNSRVPFREITERLDLSIGRVSQIVKDVTENPYVLAPGAQDCVESIMASEKEIIVGAEQEIEAYKKENLKFIKCGVEIERPETLTHIKP